MRNLLIFITKYNAFFLFLIFELSSLVIYIKYNSFQKASFINSTNQVTGYLYAQQSDLEGYLSLKEVNDSLARENAALRNQLKSSFYIDTVARHRINDTVYKVQYEYIEAKVINNSTNHSFNYLTINRGSKDGIGVGMGVICSSGIVGKVVYVTDHLASVQSMLNKDTRFSVMLAKNKEIGSIRWGDDMDPHKGLLVDVNNNAQPKYGEAVVTSGYSLFPAGIAVGKISNLHPKAGGISLNMEITFAVDYSKLQYVDVVDYKFAKEQAGLEAQQKKDD
jgi:rod shape-determining protein MreC